jgi:hypothetical protein
MAMNELYIRQKRLREIGDRGQLILSRATATIPSGFAAEPAREYLLRSGVGSVILGEESSPLEFAHARYFRFENCRNYAAGAWLATQLIVEILGLQSGSCNAKESF